MKYAVILRDGRNEYALIKTDFLPRAEAIEALSKKYFETDRHVSLSVHRPTNIDIEMHPDRQAIYAGLLGSLLPADEYVLEGEYSTL